ncbi:MAG: AMP-binding protein [Oscillatoriales cyanobacterium SM2_2_1]|nr:AMP-binding protein [Oscillatoriales cyanobacterium SM2_2_1]
MVSLLTQIQTHGDRPALRLGPHTWSYGDLAAAAAAIGAALRVYPCQNIGLMAPPGFGYGAGLLGIWAAAKMAVPLALSYPLPELEYALNHGEVGCIVGDRTLATDEYERLQAIAQEQSIPIVWVGDCRPLEAPPTLESSSPEQPALMLFTSGTTGKPKGVVHTHGSLRAQILSLTEAWGWTGGDRILHVLPLHHIHGIVNILLCALWSGAVCEFLPRFVPSQVWERLADATLFMAVPTVYVKLIAAYQQGDAATQARDRAAAQSLRLMVSGSAALPVSVLEQWQAITGHRLLERYGMTEIGMALSQPLGGDRISGSVGQPLPHVSVRLVEDTGIPGNEGEIQVQSPTLFSEYWRNPAATAAAFTTDGWFRTGDRARDEHGQFHILGRISQDILKTGGYKVSALEIEEVLRTHPAIAECAIVGVPHATWGEKICAAVVLHPQQNLTLLELRRWAKDLLAPYKIPMELKLLEHLPRNALGKVVKPQLRSLFLSPSG